MLEKNKPFLLYENYWCHGLSWCMQNWLLGFSFRCLLSTTQNSVFEHLSGFFISYWQLLFLVRFVCEQLVTFGRAEVARYVGDVSLLHSPLSMLFFQTHMPSRACIFHVRHRLSLPCYCLHLYWAGSCWINPCCGSCISVLTSHHPTCVLTVLALALLIRVHQASTFIYEVFGFISIIVCDSVAASYTISQKSFVFVLFRIFRPTCWLDPHLLICV